MKKVQIKYLRDVPEIKGITIGDWIDLYTPFNVIMTRFQYEKIPLGIAIKLPKGYEAHIVPRSSTFEKYGLIQTNGIGVIDNSYCGNDDEWHFPCITLKEIVSIPKNARICQFRIVKKQPKFFFERVPFLSDKNRGGFGSTGV